MAGLALPRTVFLFPVIVVRGRECLCFRHDIRRCFRQPVRDIVQLALVRLIVNQGAGCKSGGHQRHEFESLAVPIDHCATPRSLGCTAGWWVGTWDRSKARMGSCTGTNGALLALRVNTRNNSAR